MNDEKKSKKKKVLVIGGGAAGMMAAIAAAKEGASVTLLEKNEKTGKKLFITGKGRCNLTNACGDEEFFQSVVSNEKFLYSAFYTLDNRAVMEFFEKAGCRLKTERGNRVFPVSDHSSDVIAALNNRMRKEGIRVLLNTAVSEILTEKEVAKENTRSERKAAGGEAKDKSRVMGVKLADGKVLPADAVIIATGGKSYESTGSDGDGYRFAEKAGHTIREVKPALAPFTVKEEWCKSLQGLSLRNVSATLICKKKKLYEGFGEMLFTHFGVSGPLILSASSYYAKKINNMPAQLHIDLKPALSREQLDKRILRDFDENKNRQFKNSLNGLLPAKMIPVMIQISGIPPEKPVNEITKEERTRLLECLKNLALTVTGTRGFSEAIVTQGGVHVKEINPSTMESKLVGGLYFAGEILDTDAMTGGFNLQIAWSTGYLAGISAAANTVKGEKI